MANAINTICKIVNTDERNISNIEKITIQKGTNSITDVLISTNGSINAGGNITASGTLNANSLSIKNDINIESGDINLNDATSTLNVSGNLNVGGEFVLSDFGNQYINAADKQTFSTNNWSNLIFDNSNNIIGGKINLNGTNAIVLNFSNWVSNVDNRYFIDKIELSTTGIKIGHKVIVLALLGNVSNHEFTLLPNTIKTSIDLSVGVKFNKSYQIVELIFDGTNWVILNYTPGITLQ